MATYNRPGNMDFLSSLHLIGLNLRDVHKKVYGQYAEAADFDWFEQASGRMEGTTSDEVEHYEEGSQFQAFTIASAAAGTAPKIVVTLAAASHSADGKFSYPRLEDTVELNYNGSQWSVYAKSTAVDGAHTLTLQPIGDDDTATVGSLASTTAFVLGNTYGEGTGSPTSRNTDMEKVVYSMNIIKNGYSVTGSANTTESIIEAEIDGKTTSFLTLAGEYKAAEAFRAYKAMMLLGAHKSNAALVDANGKTKRQAIGLIPIIENKGLTVSYAGAAPVISDFDTLIKQLDARRACNEYMIRPDINLDLALDNMVNAEMQELGMRYENIGGKEVAREAGFSTFGKSTYTFHKKKMDVFSHKELFGSSTRYNNYSLLLPLGFGKDAKTGQSMPQLSVRYKSGNGLDRKNRVWLDGGMAPTPTSSVDEKNVNYLTEQCLQVIGAKDFGIFKKA